MHHGNYQKWLLGLTVLIISALSCTLPFNSINKISQIDQIVDDGIGGSSEKPAVISPGMHTSLGGDSITIHIPPGAFETERSAQLTYLPTLPINPGDGLSPLGTPIIITLSGEHSRSEEPIQVTIHFDPTGIEERGEVFVGYYHELFGWELFHPELIDLEQGSLTFLTNHFSTFSPLKGDDAARIDHYAEKSAATQYVRSRSGELGAQEVEAMVKEILKEGLRIEDNQLVEMIVKGVIANLPGGSIATAIYDGNVDDLQQATLENTIKYLGEQMTDSDSQIREFTGDLGTVLAFNKAAAAAADGNAEESLKIMADHITENIPGVGFFYKNAKRAIQIVRYSDDLWQRKEIQEAFKVYENGGKGGWLGYADVEAGDWNALVESNRSSFARLQGRYLIAVCEAEGLDPNSISEARRNQIMGEALDNLKNEFDNRIARQAEIAQIKANKLALMSMFAEKGLLDRLDVVNPMYTGEEDLEMLMTRLESFTARVLRDTGRNEIIHHAGDENIDRPGTQIYGQQVAELAWTWYNNLHKGRDAAEEAYREKLIQLKLVTVAVSYDEEEEEQEQEEEEAFDINNVEPIQFTITGSITSQLSSWEFPISPLDCNPGLGKISFTFWNVGALAGDTYAGVNLQGSSTAAFEFIWGDEQSGIEDSCETHDFAIDYSHVDWFRFSGGPNGVVMDGNTQVGRFVDGEYFILSSPGTIFTPNTFPVPDSSVFSAWD